MSFSTAMTGDLFPETVLAMMALDNARFLAPVRPGDTISTEVEVLEKRTTSRPDRGIVVFRDHVYNQHAQEVFSNDKTVLLKRRPA
jgi:acyl dehydratase